MDEHSEPGLPHEADKGVTLNTKFSMSFHGNDLQIH